MEWIVFTSGACAVLLYMIHGYVERSAKSLQQLCRAMECQRERLESIQADLIYSLEAIRSDAEDMRKTMDRLSEIYAPNLSDVDKFEREVFAARQKGGPSP